MKKLLSLMLCLALLVCSCSALAEAPEGEKESIGMIGVEDSFDIKCRLPEGYQVAITAADATSIYADVTSKDPEKPVLTVAIAFNDTYVQDGKALKLNDFSEEEIALLKESLVEMMTDSEIEDAETAYGTKLIIVKGHILERTIVQVFSVYKAYEVRVVAYKGQEASDVTLTDEQIQMIIDFLSEMDFVEA